MKILPSEILPSKFLVVDEYIVQSIEYFRDKCYDQGIEDIQIINRGLSRPWCRCLDLRVSDMYA